MENLVRWHRLFLLMSWLILRWHLMIVQAALNSGWSYPNLLNRRDYTFLEFNIYYVSRSSYSRNWWASSKGISRPNKYLHGLSKSEGCSVFVPPTQQPILPTEAGCSMASYPITLCFLCLWWPWFTVKGVSSGDHRQKCQRSWLRL